MAEAVDTIVLCLRDSEAVREVLEGEDGALAAARGKLILDTFMAVIGEATALAEAAGIPRHTALDCLADGGAKSGVMAAKKQRLLEADYSPHFAADTIYKDLDYLLDLARDSHQPVPIGALTRELFGRAYPMGLEREDFSVIHRILQEKG